MLPTTYAFGDGTATTSGSGTMTGSNKTVTGVDVSELAEGELTLNLALADAAGNFGATTSDTVILDATAPSVPIASPVANTYSSAQSVTLSSVGSDSIRYTIDGSTPTCSSGTVYSSAITVSSSQTIKAIGCDEAENGSNVASFAYTIRRPGGGGGSVSRPNPPVLPPTAAVSCPPGHLFSVLTGERCAVTTPSGQTPPASGPIILFIRNLSQGMTGEDVRDLQRFLNTHGFPVATIGPGSPGHETTFFGPLTRAALAKFQAANKITPAVGYFGSITRGY